MIEQIQTYIGYIPKAIELFRNLILKIITTLNLPVDSTSAITFLLISFYLAYLFLKQFVVQGALYRLSNLLNWILISILLYILISGVGG